MSINTRSQFFYNIVVDETNNTLEFDEGGGTLTATIPVGQYTLTDIASEVSKQMNSVGAFDYTITLNRSLRKITISASSAVSLLISSGTFVTQQLFALIGFTGSDQSTTSATSNNSIGSVFRPQVKLQNYVDANDNKNKIDASLKRSSSGIIEVVTSGLESFFEFEIMFINDNVLASPVIERNENAVSEARDFFDYCINKGALEFMPDRDTPNTYYKVLLESTPESQIGVGYKLKEMYSRNLATFYETGKLSFRSL